MSASLFSLSGKVALVTGAGSGIGQAIAVLFAQAGAGVWVADVNEAAAAGTADRIRAAGGSADPLGLDVTRDADFRAALERVPEAERAVREAAAGLPDEVRERFETADRLDDADRAVLLGLAEEVLEAFRSEAVQSPVGGAS